MRRHVGAAGDAAGAACRAVLNAADAQPRIKELRAHIADLIASCARRPAGWRARWRTTPAWPTRRVDRLSEPRSAQRQAAHERRLGRPAPRARARSQVATRSPNPSAKYREANTRENIEAAPADGRIIGRASVSNTPAYPKKLPIVLIATLATLLLTSGAIATGELLRMTAPRASGTVSPEIEREIAPEIVMVAPPEPARAPAIAPELPAAPARRGRRLSRARC